MPAADFASFEGECLNLLCEAPRCSWRVWLTLRLATKVNCQMPSLSFIAVRGRVSYA
uniref:Uncharacterized protein n=1 Tax=Arundo donax TaxID=35708 RepID=A0A0A9EM10_ARUDO